MSNHTKEVLAEALKTLMKTTPINRISVTDISGSCGLKRQTFYYHFDDKYQLVNWIFDQEILEEVSPFLTYEKWPKALEMVFTLVEKEKSFYINALHDNYCSFQNHVFETQYTITIELINALTGKDVSKNDDLIFFAEFYTNAIVGTFIGWINHHMLEKPEHIIHKLTTIISGSLKSSLSNYLTF